MILYPCHGSGGYQFFAFTTSGQIITVEELCVSNRSNTVILAKCSENDSFQLWDYNKEVSDERASFFKLRKFADFFHYS